MTSGGSNAKKDISFGGSSRGSNLNEPGPYKDFNSNYNGDFKFFNKRVEKPERRNRKMTNQQLIDALKRGDPNATVTFGIQQFNKRYPVIWLGIDSTVERDGYEMWVFHNEKNTHVTLHLPEKAYIAKLPKDN